MGNRVTAAYSIGLGAMMLTAAFILFNPSPAAAFWDGFPFAPRGANIATPEGALDFVTERLCERQAQLGNRLPVPLIDPDRCNTPPPPEPNEPTVDIVADPMTISEGGESELSWDSENADTCEALGGWSGSKALDGTEVVAPTVTTIYTIECEGDGGTVQDSVTVTVSIVDPEPETATLTLVKEVINDDDGTASATDWTLSADGPTDISGVSGSAAVTDAEVGVGAYSLSESGGPGGYEASDFSCIKNGGAAIPGNSITLEEGDVATCTVTNDDIEPELGMATLTLIKVVTNDNGGEAEAADWTLSADGPTDISGISGSGAVTEADVVAGSYDLSESGGPDGYSASVYVCQRNGGPDVLGNTIVLEDGDTATCTITNNDEPAILHIVKEVVNDDGNDATPDDFSFTINGGEEVFFEADGTNDVELDAGTYTVVETEMEGYEVSYEGCEDIVLGVGGEATCTVTNDDVGEVDEGLLLITEVLYDISTTTQGAETTDEWVELFNGTNADMDLSGYALKDNSGDIGDLFPEGTVVPAGGFLVVFGTSTTPGLWELPEGTVVLTVDGDIGGNGLANGGDKVELFDSEDVIVDAVSWGSNTEAFVPSVFPDDSDEHEGSSIHRVNNSVDTNTAVDWEENETPNPGE